MTSILESIKKLLGIAKLDTSFDTDIIFHINSTLMGLYQLGIGPVNGYTIQGYTETWTNLLGNTNYESVKSYIYLKVRLLFDTPNSSYVIDAINKQIQELEWRINVKVEGGM